MTNRRQNVNEHKTNNTTDFLVMMFCWSRFLHESWKVSLLVDSAETDFFLAKPSRQKTETAFCITHTTQHCVVSNGQRCHRQLWVRLNFQRIYFYTSLWSYTKYNSKKSGLTTRLLSHPVHARPRPAIPDLGRIFNKRPSKFWDWKTGIENCPINS